MTILTFLAKEMPIPFSSINCSRIERSGTSPKKITWLGEEFSYAKDYQERLQEVSFHH
jgi:hypothetical protein